MAMAAVREVEDAGDEEAEATEEGVLGREGGTWAVVVVKVAAQAVVEEGCLEEVAQTAAAEQAGELKVAVGTKAVALMAVAETVQAGEGMVGVEVAALVVEATVAVE